MPSTRSVVRVLLLSDTHVGYDLPARTRVARRLRGEDFLANFERALEPARRGEVDLVIHAGDVFDQPEPAAGVAELAYATLRGAADAGIPVLIVPGNHERARMPCPLLCIHPRIWVFDRPRTFTVAAKGITIAVGGFPYTRRVRAKFPALVKETGLLDYRADVRILAVHHCIEGARVSLPDGGDYMFRDATDVIAARDVPSDLAALVSGHIHRHQVLRYACPVVYCGSIERTAFAEMRETKGFVQFEFAPSTDGGTMQRLRFERLPARPMVRTKIDLEGDVPAQVRATVRAVDPNAIVRLEVPGPPRTIQGLGAATLRAVAPTTMNLVVAYEDRDPPMAPLSRARRRRASAGASPPDGTST